MDVSARVVAAPSTVTDFETARVQVYRQGYGWVDRPMTLCGWHKAVVEGLMSEPGVDVGNTRADVAASFAESCDDCRAVA